MNAPPVGALGPLNNALQIIDKRTKLIINSGLSHPQSCLKNSAHLSNFLTPRTVSVLSRSFSFSSSSFVLDHTVPYGTALLGGVFPGTSCQATIARSLRDIWQQALARGCCQMSASASRRDNTDRSLAGSAWKSVRLSLLEGFTTREGAPNGHHGQKVCTTEAMFYLCSKSFRRELIRGGGWSGSVSLSCSSKIF
jgi:hypothetical protein